MRHPVDYEPSQDFGDNPTSILPASHWIIKQFGNYQPDGHTGTDYPCPVGTPVRAVADGVVLHVGWLTGTYASNPWWISPPFAGYVAVIDHGHFIGIYGHCLDGSAGVRAGDRVAEGDLFIRSGNTGASTGPHLHFEVLPDGYVLNSYMYGRINPARLFGSAAITTQGATVPTPTKQEETDMLILVQKKGDPAIWIGNFITRRQIPDVQTLRDLQYQGAIGNLKLANDGKVQEVGNLEVAGQAI